jgi:OFA family oxalate/formate antiporter-like MFS transporter
MSAERVMGIDQRRSTELLGNRWLQLAAGVVGMIAVANFQYSWTLFIAPLEEAHGWKRVQILDALTLFFTLAQTWLMPVQSYLADRFGSRRLMVCGGILAGAAWCVCSSTDSLTVLYAAQVACGCGSGIVYAVSVGNALKWFPDRRGLAAGLTAAAFGAGSAATVVPIAQTIRVFGYESAFLWFGLGQGLVVVLAGLMMFEPPEEPKSSLGRAAGEADRTPLEMLSSGGFWLVYAMMTIGAVPGLLMMGQLAPMAGDFKVAEKSVSILGFTSAALPFALMLDRVTGGLTRPVFGWLSDHIGREPAIFLAFSLEGLSLLVLLRYANDPVMFVVMSGLAFFGWGAIFSLFPAVSADLFGRRYSTTNYGFLYTAKGAATLLVSLANRLQANTGSWELVFALMIGADAIAALLALAVLYPLRKRWRG